MNCRIFLDFPFAVQDLSRGLDWLAISPSFSAGFRKLCLNDTRLITLPRDPIQYKSIHKTLSEEGYLILACISHSWEVFLVG